MAGAAKVKCETNQRVINTGWAELKSSAVSGFKLITVEKIHLTILAVSGPPYRNF